MPEAREYSVDKPATFNDRRINSMVKGHLVVGDGEEQAMAEVAQRLKTSVEYVKAAVERVKRSGPVVRTVKTCLTDGWWLR